MGFATALGNVANTVASAIARVIIGEPILFYKAGFADAEMNPENDLFGLGRLEVTPTINIANYPTAWTKVMVMVPPGVFGGGFLPGKPGVRLTLTRPALPAGDPVVGLAAVQAAVRKFPDTTYFRVEATYALPVGPHGPGNRWSVTLTARKGSTTPPVDDVPPGQRIAATLQSSFDSQPVARLNTVAPAVLLTPDRGGLPDPGVLPQNVFDTLFDPSLPSADLPVFTMRLSVDRLSYGTARLWTSGYSATHHFAHVYIPVSNRLGAAGAGVAIGTDGGNGPVAVTLLNFQIWGVQAFFCLADGECAD